MARTRSWYGVASVISGSDYVVKLMVANGELYREILADELMRTMSMHDLGINCHLSARQ